MLKSSANLYWLTAVGLYQVPDEVDSLGLPIVCVCECLCVRRARVWVVKGGGWDGPRGRWYVGKLAGNTGPPNTLLLHTVGAVASMPKELTWAAQAG